jgi:apolipoprotein N-acyltransferase
MWPLAAAAFGGWLNAMAFPPLGWWGLAFVGTPLLLAAAAAGPLRMSALAGIVGGAVFWGTLTQWLTVYLGPVPWLALTAFEAGIFTGGMVVIGWGWRVIDRSISRPGARVLVAPALIGGLWVLQETVASRWPYGGFSWGRLAFAQAAGPFADLAAWGGASGLSFVIAAFSALLVALSRSGLLRRRRWMALPIVIAVALLAVPPFPVAEQGKLRVGAVQGDSEAGLLAGNEPGRILDDHLRAADAIRGQEMDLLVWPENASDLNPLEYPAAADALDQVSRDVDAPVIVGTITRSGDERFNSLLLWNAGSGASAQYDKKHPVPFAEYLPDRDFWYPLAPDLFDLVPRDLSIGARPNVFDVEGVAAGLAICFDIVDDGLIRDMVSDGAQVILAPSNNADFGRTSQSAQQLGIARLRAVEAGRAVVNISTVGGSAMIGSDGSTITALGSFRPGAMVAEVPLSDAVTPAMSFGDALLSAGLTLTLLGLASCTVIARRRPGRR